MPGILCFLLAGHRIMTHHVETTPEIKGEFQELSSVNTAFPITHPHIKDLGEVIANAISQNTNLSKGYSLELLKGHNFIRVNLRNKHNWMLLQQLVIISINNSGFYTVNVNRDLILQGESDNQLNRVVNILVNFLTQFAYP